MCQVDLYEAVRQCCLRDCTQGQKVPGILSTKMFVPLVGCYLFVYWCSYTFIFAQTGFTHNKKTKSRQPCQWLWVSVSGWSYKDFCCCDNLLKNLRLQLTPIIAMKPKLRILDSTYKWKEELHSNGTLSLLLPQLERSARLVFVPDAVIRSDVK